MSKYALEIRDQLKTFDDLQIALNEYSNAKQVEPKIRLHKINEQHENDLFFGVVKWFDEKKDFGFLRCEDFEPHDVFVHSTLLARVGVDKLFRGQAAYFNPFSAEGFINKCKVAYLKLAEDMPWWEVGFGDDTTWENEWIQAPDKETAYKYTGFLSSNIKVDQAYEVKEIHNPYERCILYDESSDLYLVLTNGGEDFDQTDDIKRATVFQDEPYKLSLSRILFSYGDKKLLSGETLKSLKETLFFKPIEI